MDVAEKYAQAEVVAFWEQLSRQGLQACEQIMLDRYATSNGRVLDLGCGGGRAGLSLIPQGYRVAGLDITWEMARTAHREHRRARLPADIVQADLQSLPFTPQSYDVVLILIAALQHIPYQAARRSALAGIRRVLRPGGVLVLALDNVAPALTCYAWWGWRRLMSIGRRTDHQTPPDAGSGLPRTTAADSLIAARRSERSALGWHVRGLLRSLRWRTWTGWQDRARRLRLLSGEVGDTTIDQVSLSATPGRVFYHIYEYNELLIDAAEAGLKLLGYHSGRELSEDQRFPPRVRQLDKQVLFAFQRP